MNESRSFQTDNLNDFVSLRLLDRLDRWGMTPAQVDRALGRGPGWTKRRTSGGVRWSLKDLEEIQQKIGIRPEYLIGLSELPGTRRA